MDRRSFFRKGAAGTLTGVAAVLAKTDRCQGCGAKLDGGHCTFCGNGQELGGYGGKPIPKPDLRNIVELMKVESPSFIQWDKAVPMGVSYTEHKLSFFDAVIQAEGMARELSPPPQKPTGKRSLTGLPVLKDNATPWLAVAMQGKAIVESLPGFMPFNGDAEWPFLGTLGCRWAVIELLPQDVEALSWGGPDPDSDWVSGSAVFGVGNSNTWVAGQILNC